MATSSSASASVFSKYGYGYDETGKFIMPPGCVFSPNESEIFDHFLWNYIMGHPSSSDHIKHINMDALDPILLPTHVFKNGDYRNQAYYFTQLERQYTKRPFSKRITESGYWEAVGNGMIVIWDKDIVGFQQKFVFHQGKPPNGTKTTWTMNEYKLYPGYLSVEERKDSGIMEKVDTYALCTIQKGEEEKSVQKAESRVQKT